MPDNGFDLGLNKRQLGGLNQQGLSSSAVIFFELAMFGHLRFTKGKIKIVLASKLPELMKLDSGEPPLLIAIEFVKLTLVMKQKDLIA